MVRQLAPDPTAGGRPAGPETFADMIRRLRVRAGLSQNQLARGASIDPAYINRLERTDGTPSRSVVLRIWGALETTVDDRERLLVAAGYCPEMIRRVGWDGYIRSMRTRLRDALDQLDTALSVPPDGTGDDQPWG